MANEDEDARAFHDAKLRSLRLAMAHDTEAALAVISPYTDATREPEMRQTALQHRAILLAHGERFDEAWQDLLAAYAIPHGDTFRRSMLALALGMNAEARRDRAAELEWYRESARIATNDPQFEVAVAVCGHALLDAVGEDNLEASDRAVCVALLERSWTHLRIAGTPDHTRLKASYERVRATERELARKPGGGDAP